MYNFENFEESPLFNLVSDTFGGTELVDAEHQANRSFQYIDDTVKREVSRICKEVSQGVNYASLNGKFYYKYDISKTVPEPVTVCVVHYLKSKNFVVADFPNQYCHCLYITWAHVEGTDTASTEVTER